MTSKPTILVVDDELSIRESFNLILSSKYRVLQAASGEGALGQIADHVIDLVYLDIRMPGMDGIETLKRIKEISSQTEVIMVTAVNDVQKASQAIKLSAYDYVVKPFDVNNILDLTENLLRRKGLVSAARGIGAPEVPLLVGGTEKISEAQRTIEKTGGLADWALITGESGVEKEWAARLMHQRSETAKPFMAFDIRGKSLGLIDKTLFGEKEGSTVADLRREIGVVNEAGTLFIDNVELLPQEAQEKLLNAPVRVVCGTSVNLKETNVNPELWDKISRIQVDIPPLRDRSADIPMLLDFFLNEAKSRHGGAVKEIMPQAVDLLSSYIWPGNTAELKAVVEKLVLTAEDPVVGVNGLPINILISQARALPIEDAYEEFEKKYISDVMDMNSKDKEKAAKLLNIQLQVLETKL